MLGSWGRRISSKSASTTLVPGHPGLHWDSEASLAYMRKKKNEHGSDKVSVKESITLLIALLDKVSVKEFITLLIALLG